MFIDLYEDESLITYQNNRYTKAIEEFIKLYDDQDIEMSLNSANLIVRIFAVLDRRVGKRRLTLMKKKIQEKSDTFQEFFAIRAKAEGLL